MLGALGRIVTLTRVARLSSFRCLLLFIVVLLCSVEGSAEDAAVISFAPTPLATQGEQAAAINHALQAMTRGDTRVLVDLPISAFTAPIGIIDSKHPTIIRRWTAMLHQVVTRVPAEKSPQVIDALEALFLLICASDTAQATSLAADFLPSPAAQKFLQRQADHAYDHGLFGAFLAHARGLSLAEKNSLSLSERMSIAQRLLGVGDRVDPASALHAPALLKEPGIISPPPLSTPGITVNWRTIPGWLMACDADGQTLWQFRCAQNANIHTGPGGAIVSDATGTTVLDETGQPFSFPPIPHEALILGIRGASVWFHIGPRIWRHSIADHRVTEMHLEDSPLDLPIVRGPRSLWLGTEELILVEDSRTIARWRVRSGPGTRLIDHWPNNGDIGLRRSDGTTYPIHHLDQLLTDDATTLAQRAWLFAYAQRPDDAVLALREAEKKSGIDSSVESIALVNAHLALGTEHIRTCWKNIFALAQRAGTAQQCASILGCALPDPEALSALRTLLATHPDLIVPTAQNHSDLDNVAQWELQRTGRSWLTKHDSPARFTLLDLLDRNPAHWNRLNEIPLALSSHSNDDDSTVEPDGSVITKNIRLRAERTAERCTMMVSTLTGQRLWQHAWWALPESQAPSTIITVRNDIVYLQEGDNRLSALNSADGTLINRVVLPPGCSDVYDVTIPNHHDLVVLSPPGSAHRAWIINNKNYISIALPCAGRWLMPLGGQAIVALDDGGVVSLPDLHPVTLPEKLLIGPRPRIGSEGIAQGQLLYSWLVPSP